MKQGQNFEVLQANDITDIYKIILLPTKYDIF